MSAHSESVITVGLDASPPLPLHTGHPGEGFEVDLLKAIAKRTGFKIRYRSALWNELVQHLVDHQLDMICTAATITADRKRVVDFSEPYLEFELAIVVRRECEDIGDLPDLAGKSVGVRVATTAEEFARKHLTRSLLKSYHFNTEAYSALTDGTLHAVLEDAPIAKGFEALLHEVRVASTVDGTKSQYGIMFARGNDELRTTVNQALGALREDGTYDTLYRKWFT